MRRGTRWSSWVIVLSLALGTGANVAVYSALNALLFRVPPGLQASHDLVDIYTSQINGATYGPSSWADFQSIAEAPAGLTTVAAIDDRGEMNVQLAGVTRLARVDAVSPAFWQVLGAGPLRGVWPTPTSGNGLVLSDDLWAALGRDPAIIGRTVTLDGRVHRVAAVAAAGFRGLRLARPTDVWIPLEAGSAARGDRHLAIVARRAAELPAVQRRLETIGRDLARRYPDTNLGTLRSPDEARRLTARAYSRLEPAMRERAVIMGAVVSAVALLLLFSACVNAGSLLLSRGIARRSELAIRTALGAGRGHLVRGLLAESVKLSLAGAAGGVLLAMWTSRSIPALFAPEQASLLDASIDWRVAAISLAVAGLAGVVFGVAPAAISTRALETEALSGDEGRIGPRPAAARLRTLLVAAQLALSTVFLIGAVLLGRVLHTAVTVSRSSMDAATMVAAVDKAGAEFRANVDAALSRIPGVSIAGWVGTPPLERPIHAVYVITRGAQRESVTFAINYASPEFFRIMHMPMLDATPAVPGTPAPVIVNEALADRYFAGRAVGKYVVDALGHTRRIVAVVRTPIYRVFEGESEPTVFLPMKESASPAFHAVIYLKQPVAAATRQQVIDALHAGGRGATVRVATLDQMLEEALAPDRMLVTLVTGCGLLALLLAGIGVHGVMADLVRRRTREIGLRVALGAGPARVVAMVAGAGAAPASGGIAAGMAASFLIVRLAATVVFGIPPIDVALALTTAATIAGVVLAALAVPSLRALRISPLIALRTR